MQNQDQENVLYTPQQTAALAKFLRQQTAPEIAAEIGVTERTVQNWISKFGWRALRDDSPADLVLRQRVAYLMWVDQKSERQLKELDILLKHTFGDPKTKNNKARDGSNRGRPANRVRNDISNITAEKLKKFAQDTFFKYQLQIRDTKKDPKLNWVRFYLKSRQIGLTYYFAFEAFEDAVLTGDNQIFMSASKKQSEIFKTYIRMFAAKIGEVDLKGKDEIQLSNGATLYFLSTNSRTAQGFHGHVYFDEVFWIPKFAEFDNLAGGMAMHSKWRSTYLSTPSSIAHEAYPKWAGDKKHKIDISHSALKNGSLGPDLIYRQIITIHDAISGGANFFDLDKLRLKYPDKEIFDNLLMCKFLDDTSSVFALRLLMACKVDSGEWRDVNFDAIRPVGDRPVWVGYDPSGGDDDAALVVGLAPTRPGGAVRLIEKIKMSGMSYESQAEEIKNICWKYNVTGLAMDTTGIGAPTAELVEVFYPNLTRIIYNISTKNMLVYKAREVIQAGRLQFDGSWDDLIHSFLMIRREITQRSGASTFVARRTKDSAHADLAFAAMHLLSLEGVNIHDNLSPTVSF